MDGDAGCTGRSPLSYGITGGSGAWSCRHKEDRGTFRFTMPGLALSVSSLLSRSAAASGNLRTPPNKRLKLAGARK